MNSHHAFEIDSLSTIIRRITAWVADLVLVILLACLLVNAFGTRVIMRGGSMAPTLSDENGLLLNRLKGSLLDIERFDIVAYRLSGGDSVYLKRVLALPGEELQLKDGRVYINGSLLEDERMSFTIASPGIAAEPVTLGEGEYFVIGENSDGSLDSRFSEVGNISLSQILGTVWFRYAPFRELKPVH